MVVLVPTYASLIAFLRQERQNQGLTQHALAKKIKTTQSTISDWENETMFPTMDNLYRWAEALNVTFSVVMRRL